MSDTESAADEPKKASMLPAILALVGGLAIGGGAGVVAVGPAFANRTLRHATAGDSAAAERDASSSGSEHDGGDGAAPPVQSIENLVLNPAETNGTRFLMLTISLEATDDKALQALKDRDAEVRDAALRLLATKTVAQLADVSRRDGLKTELQDTLNATLNARAVRRIYFPQFVIQ